MQNRKEEEETFFSRELQKEKDLEKKGENPFIRRYFFKKKRDQYLW